jgi:hypothetical protein
MASHPLPLASISVFLRTKTHGFRGSLWTEWVRYGTSFLPPARLMTISNPHQVVGRLPPDSKHLHKATLNATLDFNSPLCPLGKAVKHTHKQTPHTHTHGPVADEEGVASQAERDSAFKTPSPHLGRSIPALSSSSIVASLFCPRSCVAPIVLRPLGSQGHAVM